MVERSPATMRAAVLTGPRSFRIDRVAVPAVERGQVLVQVEGCGFCGSNVPVWEGRPWFSYPQSPGTPGHEGWGRVVRLGPDVTQVDVGNRVAFLSNTAFADYDSVRSDQVVSIPGSLDAVDVPAEPMACAMNVARRSRFREGQHVAVVGIGFLGALLVRLAKREGAIVYALSRRDYSLEVAREMGADETFCLSESDDVLVDGIRERTGGAGCHVAVEAVGLQAPLSLASRLVRTRGRLVIAGFHQDGPREVDLQLWNWNGLDVINAHERDPRMYVEGMRAVLDLVASGELDLTRLVTHRFPLERLGEGLDALVERPSGFLKGVVIP